MHKHEGWTEFVGCVCTVQSDLYKMKAYAVAKRGFTKPCQPDRVAWYESAKMLAIEYIVLYLARHTLTKTTNTTKVTKLKQTEI